MLSTFVRKRSSAGVVTMRYPPGRIARRYTVDFGRRFVECKNARAVKSDPAFISLREDILALIQSAPNVAELLPTAA